MAKIGFCKGTTAEWKEVESQLILDDGEVGVEVTTAGKYVTRMGNGKDKYFGLPITNSSDQYENLSSLITQATSVTERATKAAENAEKAYNLVKDTSVGDLALKVDDINSNLSNKLDIMIGRSYSSDENVITGYYFKIAEFNINLSSNVFLQFNMNFLTTSITQGGTSAFNSICSMALRNQGGELASYSYIAVSCDKPANYRNDRLFLNYNAENSVIYCEFWTFLDQRWTGVTLEPIGSVKGLSSVVPFKTYSWTKNLNEGQVSQPVGTKIYATTAFGKS